MKKLQKFKWAISEFYCWCWLRTIGRIKVRLIKKITDKLEKEVFGKRDS